MQDNDIYSVLLRASGGITCVVSIIILLFDVFWELLKICCSLVLRAAQFSFHCMPTIKQITNIYYEF